MLVGVAVFFFLASLVQLFYLHERIADAPGLEVGLGCSTAVEASLQGPDRITCQQMRTAAVLEGNLVARRYHQLNVSMMSRVWSHYLGFVTGMMLALVGAAFVLGRVSGSDTTIDAKAESLQTSLRSASPGIVLCFLGVVLMITTIITYHPIESRDTAIYFKPFDGSGPSDKPPIIP